MQQKWFLLMSWPGEAHLQDTFWPKIGSLVVFAVAFVVMQRSYRASLQLPLCGRDKPQIEETQDPRHSP